MRMTAWIVHDAVLLHWPIASQSHVVRRIRVLWRSYLEHIGLVYTLVNRHYLLGEDRTLQVTVHVGLVLSLGLDNLLDLAGHLNVSWEARWTRLSFVERVFLVLLTERSFMHWRHQ